MVRAPLPKGTTMKPTILIAAALPMLAACAQRPDAIAPADMPARMYSDVSCSAARAEFAQVSDRLAALEKQQNDAATGDAIGVFLIGVPTSSLTGGDKAGQISVEKGRKLALEARMRGC